MRRTAPVFLLKIMCMYYNKIKKSSNFNNNIKSVLVLDHIKIGHRKLVVYGEYLYIQAK